MPTEEKAPLLDESNGIERIVLETEPKETVAISIDRCGPTSADCPPTDGSTLERYRGRSHYRRRDLYLSQRQRRKTHSTTQHKTEQASEQHRDIVHTCKSRCIQYEGVSAIGMAPDCCPSPAARTAIACPIASSFKACSARLKAARAMAAAADARARSIDVSMHASSLS